MLHQCSRRSSPPSFFSRPEIEVAAIIHSVKKQAAAIFDQANGTRSAQDYRDKSITSCARFIDIFVGASIIRFRVKGEELAT